MDLVSFFLSPSYVFPVDTHCKCILTSGTVLLDGGKSTWENVWHSCMERLHSQKSHPVTPETPLQSRPGTSLDFKLF